MTHVLVARLDNDGDVLLAGPAIRAAAAGADRVTLLCGPRGRHAAELLPGVDDVLVHRAAWIDPEPRPFEQEPIRRLLLELARRAVDEAIVLTSFHQSPLPLALLLRLAGVPRIGAISDDWPGSLLDVRHRVPGDVHEVERSLSLLAAMGRPLPEDDDGALRIRRLDDTAAAAARPFPPGAPYVVVHPGASVPARAWAAERHAELVGALAAAGRGVAVTGSADERALTARVAAGARPAPDGARDGRAAPARTPDLGPAPARTPDLGPAPARVRDLGPARARVRDLGGATDLAQLAAVIAGAEAIVVGNTGPAHLAAAVGTPVVSLYAPTVPAVRWRPWRVPHELLHLPVPCAGCRARSCPVPGHPCVDPLPLAAVLDALRRLATPAREAAAA